MVEVSSSLPAPASSASVLERWGKGSVLKKNYLEKECIHITAFHRESLALSSLCSGRVLLLQILQLSTCKYSIISHNIML